MNAAPSLPLSDAAARFADVLFAWWLLRAAGSQPADGRDEALHRWENEGGNIK